MDQRFCKGSLMETSRARDPGGPPDDPTPHLPLTHSLLDGEKTGAVLLFSGLFLTLVGVSFTTMGWHHYQDSPSFEWTQLLGPVLISVGGTFVLTSVCKFGIISCWPCTRWDKDVLVMPVMEETPTGHPFTLSGSNQPIMLHNATAVLCVPPQYNFITHQAAGVRAACSPRDTVHCVDNIAFTAEEEEEEEEDGSVSCTETDFRTSRTEKTEDAGGHGASCSPPPAYEDIYPPLTNISGHKDT